MLFLKFSKSQIAILPIVTFVNCTANHWALSWFFKEEIDQCRIMAEERSMPQKVFFQDGSIAAEGNGFFRRNIPYDTLVKTGSWNYWHPNGNFKARVNYEIDCYVQCCTGGICPQPYDVRKGTFELFWENGQIMSKGKFKLSHQKIDTSCGGDKIHVSFIPESAIFYAKSNGQTDGNTVLSEIGNMDEWLQEGWPDT